MPGPYLGRAIACLRIERGWKRKDLCREAEISYPFLAEIENGKKLPSSKMLAQIAWALDVRRSSILARAEQIQERWP